MNYLKLEIVPGHDAPKYWSGTGLTCEKVVITEQGTEKGLPIVDFVMVGPDGQMYLLVMTGRILIAAAAAVQGVNMRNHGVVDP